MATYEHDSCGIILAVEKSGQPSRENVLFALEALRTMQHRAGFVCGEGDGCGLLLDLPRELWRRRLKESGHGEAAVHCSDTGFFVGHFFLEQAEVWVQTEGINRLLRAAGADVLWSAPGRVRSEVLGPGGKAGEPAFWQVAGVLPNGGAGAGDNAWLDECERVEKTLFELALAIEQEVGAHVVSLSSQTAVYKARGTADVLAEYYVDLGERELASVATIGHNRYSTNTATAFERVQPFTLLGHNGEINTIARLREEAAMHDIPLVEGGSDSQDMDRVLAAFRHRFGLSLIEGLEILFPPIINEIKQYPPELRDLYIYLRMAWGPLAQGPAAVVARSGRECAASVDAVGLRPLWFLETEGRYVFASERGIVKTAEMTADPKPLAPGEKMALFLGPENGVRVLDYREIQAHVAESLKKRVPTVLDGFAAHLDDGTAGRGVPAETTEETAAAAAQEAAAPAESQDRLLAACGWQADDIRWARAMADSGAEPIYSLGYDSPLAALAPGLHNLADFFKETVAVVTNPAIDREREIEHFSTRSLIGPRTELPGEADVTDGDQKLAEHRETGADAGFTFSGAPPRFYLPTPLLVGEPPSQGGRGTKGKAERRAGVPELSWRMAARALRTLSLEDCMAAAGMERVGRISCAFSQGETVSAALARLGAEAVKMADGGATLLVLDDADAFADGRLPLDPHLVTAAVTGALRNKGAGSANRRRKVGIVVSSAALRNLHDIMICLGLGADAVHPYLLWRLAWQQAGERGLVNLGEALRKGIEKVLSTLGIHELFGYSRLFSSIGLRQEVADVFGTQNFAGGEKAGFGWEDLTREAWLRWRMARGLVSGEVAKPFQLNGRVWKTVHDVASGTATSPTALADTLRQFEEKSPVSLRHVLDFALPATSAPESTPAGEPDASVGGHSLPFFIASMSFGSQSETAFRAYAEAAHRLNILCLNGEGGEIADLLGRYYPNRGIQIASGRFGINVSLLNGGCVIEIKVGQGAKPGEGGHLPGAKVSAKVAAARHAKPGVDLISPSNNHDIYSIEDLAQFITELKTANPRARVAVKVPVVPGIGTIAVGIVKAGADIVSLSGFDGGTGAARAHALRHAGLPVEIGVVETHRALVGAGLRDAAEIWADGGVKSGYDALKLMLLGANRVGFGTLAMFALGCTACHGCHKGTCHRGIATQVETVEEAREKGLKAFTPLDFDESVRRLVRLFEAMGSELRAMAKRLGAVRVQDLVGRADLLRQVRAVERLDLAELLVPPEAGRSWGIKTEPPYRSTGLADTTLAKTIEEGVLGGEEDGSGQGWGHESASAISVGPVAGADRVLVTGLSGEIARRRLGGLSRAHSPKEVRIALQAGGGAAGGGFAAFHAAGVTVVARGGAQDGAAKSAAGGKVVILKAPGADGRLIDGSVGKSFAYGAQEGLFLIQGNADSRCGIRLSGADIVIGGGLDRLRGGRGRKDRGDARRGWGGNIALDASIKGFAFEYMTDGRAVVLGDPGPWICSGMTGGVVYLLLQPELGLDEAAMARRVAKGAKVTFCRPGSVGQRDLAELLSAYAEELRVDGQNEEAAEVLALLEDYRSRFIAVRPLDQAAVDDGEIIPLDQFPRQGVIVDASSENRREPGTAPGWVAK